jgi:short-subunit dehydrogenase
MRARGRGGVILVSSMAGLAGGALIAAYAASKAFEIVLAESLWYEFGTAGVHVLGLIAGATSTPAMLRSGMTFGSTDRDAARAGDGPATSTVPMHSDDVAREALAQLGRVPIHVAGEANREAAMGLRSAPREQVVPAMSAAVAEMYRVPLPPRLP